MGRHVSAILSSRAKIKLKIQWYMCSQFYSDWRARKPRKSANCELPLGGGTRAAADNTGGWVSQRRVARH
jgi:hypothetical protein